jgi:hypothetical protein
VTPLWSKQGCPACSLERCPGWAAPVLPGGLEPMATTLEEIAAYRLKDIDEALDAMRSALDYFHREHDQRAIFLRAYMKQAAWGPR